MGGTGNDIIFGGEGGEEMQGDQGDDWIDGGTDGGDVLFGDVGAPTGGFPLYAGNDVLIGGVGTVMKGFSGDDIMLGVGGFTSSTAASASIGPRSSTRPRASRSTWLAGSSSPTNSSGRRRRFPRPLPADGSRQRLDVRRRHQG